MIASLDVSVQPAADVLVRELDGEGVMLKRGTGMYFGVDAVGLRMWQLCAERLPLRAVAEAVGREYDAAPDRIEADLLAFVGELAANGLVTAA